MIVERLDEVQYRFNQRTISLVVMIIFLIIGVILVVFEINNDRITMKNQLYSDHKIVSNEIMLKNLIMEYQLDQSVEYRKSYLNNYGFHTNDPHFDLIDNSEELFGDTLDYYGYRIYVYSSQPLDENDFARTDDINHMISFVRTIGDQDIDGIYIYQSQLHSYTIIYPLGDTRNDVQGNQEEIRKIATEFMSIDKAYSYSELVGDTLYRWVNIINMTKVDQSGFALVNPASSIDIDSQRFIDVTIRTPNGDLVLHGDSFSLVETRDLPIGLSYELRSETDGDYIYYTRKISDDLSYIGRSSDNLIFLESIAQNSSFILIVTLAFFVMVLAYLFLLRYKKYLDLEVQSNEQEMKKSIYKSRLGYVMNTISEAFIRADEEFRIIEVNQAAADMLGYQIVDILGRNLGDFIFGGMERDLEESDGLYHRYELNLKHKSGRVIRCLVNQSTIIKDIQNNREHYIMVTDITPLMEAQMRAEEANRSKSRFIANLSHEIRTPMNATIGYIYLLEQTKLTDVQKKYLEKMDYASNSLLEIIDEILDFSKIEADSILVENVSFSLTKVISNALSMFDTEAYKKRIDYEINFDDKLPDHVYGDPYRIRQVVVNLLSNAFKFTSKGLISVNVFPAGQKYQIVEPSHDEIWVRIVIEDTGIGIAEDRMESLFEPFVQADESTTRLYGGTGLGLAICKRLVTLMNGRISARSTLGQGSSFYVDLPLQAAEESKIEVGEAPRDILVKPKANKKILIVEDNPLNQELLVELCIQEGCKVVVANNGKVAEEIITSDHTKKFDLILMDIQMPLQDGYETTRFIRNSDNYRDIPIVAVTANADRETQNMISDSGMDGYVLKPISAVELYSKISTFL